MAKVNLYIEDTEIKLLVSSGNRVDKWASLMLEEGLVDQGLVLDEERVSEAIKQLFKLQSVGTGSVTLGLSGLNSIFRIISIPEVSRNLLAEAVGNEAARVLPVPLSQVYYSYQLLPSPKGDMRLFLAAYPRQSTETLIATAVKAGLKPSSVDLAPLGLARCVNLPRTIIVNSWLTFLDIIIMVERVPQVIRSLSLPVESTSLHDRLPAIIEEITRTVTFYNSSSQGNTLDKSVPIVICGDLALEEQNWKPLERLGYPVQAFKPPMEYKAAFDPTKFAVNCGLALKGQTPGGTANNSLIDFNALPGSYKTPSFSWGRVLAPVGLVVALGALGWGYLLVKDIQDEAGRLENQVRGVQAEIVRQRSDNAALEANIAQVIADAEAFPPQVTQIQTRLNQISAQQGFFNTLIDDFASSLDDGNLDLREIIALAPADIDIESVDGESEGYHITGRSPSESLVLDYGRALVDGGRFANVLISSIAASQDEDSASPVLVFEIILR